MGVELGGGVVIRGPDVPRGTGVPPVGPMGGTPMPRRCPPGEILQALGQLEAEIQQGMKELEGMLQ